MLTAVVSLPPHTFKPSADVGVKASLVFLQKKYPDQDVGDYPIFMAMVEHVGYDATGREDKNELPEVAEAYISRSGRLGQISDQPLTFQVYYSELKRRWDAYYYQPKFIQAIRETRAISSMAQMQKLGDIITSLAGGATPKAKSKAYTDKEHGVPFLRIQNITEEGIDLFNVEYITPEIHNGLLKRSQLQPGDLLLTITGRVGTAVVVPASLHEANINQHMVRIRLKEGVNPWYVAAFLNSKWGQNQTQRAVTGTTRIALDYTAIKEIEIPLPPHRNQDRIAEMMAEAYKERKQKLAEAEHVVANAKENMERILRESV